ncbi:hypothetical protein A2154_04415 [Candidatus Gottesmanbacteria bacterium RBG_16_43_7]|uniref:Uncharacterized protein n=1 Tax=Candidatus Gottesmanbacteria bacterium RBG_16_43_7 TaxID=1798373 RepID=A0A1F5ZC25_9BACT|nr:MAG: hypothetical protein A2154_04415 [Candidatus Gottesmanbacteria bacterium RBG_16_43_7]
MLEPGRSWPIRIECDTGLPIKLADIEDIWIKINFFHDYHQNPQPRNEYDKLQIEPVPENDPRVEELIKMLNYLDALASGSEKLPQEPLIVNYSPTSVDKQLASLILFNRTKWFMPILSNINQSQSLFQPLEIDPRTGKLDQQSITVLRNRYRAWALFLKSYEGQAQNIQIEQYIRDVEAAISVDNSWNEMSLSDKAELQAKFKVVQHESIVGSNDQVIITDVMARLPDGTMLGKTTDPEAQKVILEKIAKVKVIEACVGIAYTRLIVSSWPVKILDRLTRENYENLVCGHVNYRVQLSDITPADIEILIKQASEEMAKSGLVIDVFGKYGSKYVRKIEVQDNKTGAWSTIVGEEAWTTVIGFPIKGVLEVLQTARQAGFCQSLDPESSLIDAYAANKQLLNQLKGEPRFNFNLPDFPDNLTSLTDKSQ